MFYDDDKDGIFAGPDVALANTKIYLVIPVKARDVATPTVLGSGFTDGSGKLVIKGFQAMANTQVALVINSPSNQPVIVFTTNALGSAFKLVVAVDRPVLVSVVCQQVEELR